MELFLPDQIVLNEASKALIGDLEETARRVHEYRPLPPEVVKRVLDGLLGERVYASNAIEGNTLDLRETVTVLNTGRILENRRREATEARNLGEAVKGITERVKLGPDVHTIDQLLAIHKLILRETPDEYWGGRFRDGRVVIEGAKYQPPDQTIVPTLVERTMERLRACTGAPSLLEACWVHWAIARVHPFKDGNGRLARLWQDLLLFQANLTCAIIRPEDRRQYLDALTQADEGDFNSLVQLTASRVLTTFDRYLAEIARDKELDAFVKEVTGVADTRIGEKEQRSYQRWARSMEQLRWEFEVCAARITEASNTIRLQLKKYAVIDREKWANIRLGLSSEEPLFFTLAVSVGKRERSYYFIFRKCDWYASAQEPGDLLCGVSIAGMDGPLTPPPLTGTFLSQFGKVSPSAVADPWITEAVVIDGGFHVCNFNGKTQQSRSESGVAAMRVAQDFIREVVLSRMT